MKPTVQVVISDLRHKSLFNDTPKQTGSCVQLFVWVLRKEPVLFKQVAKHAQKNVLETKQKKAIIF